MELDPQFSGYLMELFAKKLISISWLSLGVTVSGALGYTMECRDDSVWHSGGSSCERSKSKKAISTRVSRAVPHLSTHLALIRLTSEFGWDPVHLD